MDIRKSRILRIIAILILLICCLVSGFAFYYSNQQKQTRETTIAAITNDFTEYFYTEGHDVNSVLGGSKYYLPKGFAVTYQSGTNAKLMNDGQEFTFSVNELSAKTITLLDSELLQSTEKTTTVYRTDFTTLMKDGYIYVYVKGDKVKKSDITMDTHVVMIVAAGNGRIQAEMPFREMPKYMKQISLIINSVNVPFEDVKQQDAFSSGKEE